MKSNCNIICELVESDKDGDVYLIDVYFNVALSSLIGL